MKTFTYEEFRDYYFKNKRFPNGAYVNRDKTLNDNQLKSKYATYVKSIERQELNRQKQFEKQKEKRQSDYENKTYIDEKWEVCKKEVWERDKGKCQLLDITYPEELVRYDLKGLLNCKEFSQLDVAHVFGKGAYPKMKYITDNMILLSRVFHSRLDNYCDPFTGKPIDKDTHTLWWRDIVGDELYDKLLEMTKLK